MDPKTPRDGTTSPFNSMTPTTGTNFLIDPAGASGARSGVNFLDQPAGAGPSAGKPSLAEAGPQKTGTDDPNPQSEVKQDSGPGFRPDATVPGNSPRRDQIGVGSVGDSRKPFKLSGG